MFTDLLKPIAKEFSGKRAWLDVNRLWQFRNTVCTPSLREACAYSVERFRENRRAVLVGTDSFWEGMSVRGEGLRLVIIPRVPFRVPTEPLQQARHERIQAEGGDPFRHYALPEAVLKLRQGYGRLIRSHTDQGVVLLLDRRVHERRYGQILLRSLPPARRVTGPWRLVREALIRKLDVS